MVETAEELLRNIQRSVDEIKAVLKLVNQEKLQQMRNDLLKDGSVKKQVYDLCDGAKTTQDMAAVLQKETGYVSSYINILRREGLVRTIEKDGKQVHEQIF